MSDESRGSAPIDLNHHQSVARWVLQDLVLIISPTSALGVLRVALGARRIRRAGSPQRRRPRGEPLTGTDRGRTVRSQSRLRDPASGMSMGNPQNASGIREDQCVEDVRGLYQLSASADSNGQEGSKNVC
jgi:hypothetical protein